MEKNNRTTLTITKEAKEILDRIGRKNENYSELVTRLAKQVDSICNRRVDTKEPNEMEDEIQNEE